MLFYFSFLCIAFYYTYGQYFADPLKTVVFKRDKNIDEYKILLPPMPSWVTPDDIALFLFPDHFIIWAKGSGNSMNKLYLNEDEHNYTELRGRALTSLPFRNSFRGLRSLG